MAKDVVPAAVDMLREVGAALFAGYLSPATAAYLVIVLAFHNRGKKVEGDHG